MSLRQLRDTNFERSQNPNFVVWRHYIFRAEENHETQTKQGKVSRTHYGIYPGFNQAVTDGFEIHATTTLI